MTSLSTSAIVSRAWFSLALIYPSRAPVASYLLIHLVLSYNIICILYSKCTSLTDMILFSPLTLRKCLICRLKCTYLGISKGQFMCQALRSLCQWSNSLKNRGGRASLMTSNMIPNQSCLQKSVSWIIGGLGYPKVSVSRGGASGR